MSKITQVRQDAVKFDLTINDDLPEMFTDGVSNMVMGNPVSKLTFHSVTTPAQSESEVEQRKAVLLLTIPTAVLLEMCRNILFTAQSNIDKFENAGSQVNSRVKLAMNGVNIPSSTFTNASAQPAIKKQK